MDAVEECEEAFHDAVEPPDEELELKSTPKSILDAVSAKEEGNK
jgi:hypothetical protein